jgi:hypothetical protein
MLRDATPSASDLQCLIEAVRKGRLVRGDFLRAFSIVPKVNCNLSVDFNPYLGSTTRPDQFERPNLRVLVLGGKWHAISQRPGLQCSVDGGEIHGGDSFSGLHPHPKPLNQLVFCAGIRVIVRLTLPSLGSLLHLFVIEAGKIHDLADRRTCLGVYLYQVEVCLPGHASRLFDSENTEHDSIGSDHPYFWNANEIVDTGHDENADV